MKLPDTLRLANPGKFKRTVKTEMRAWYLAFLQKYQQQGRLNTAKPPIGAFRHYLNRKLARLRPHRVKDEGVARGVWKIPCKLTASEAWKLLNSTFTALLESDNISLIVEALGHANDNRPALIGWKKIAPRVAERKVAVVAQSPKKYVPRQPHIFSDYIDDNGPLPTDKRRYVTLWEDFLLPEHNARYVKWWEQALRLRQGRQRQPLTQAQRQAIAAAEAARRPKAPAPRKVLYARGSQVVSISAPAENVESLEHRLYEAIQQPWFFGDDKSSKHRKRRFLHEPGMQAAYDAFRAQVREANRIPSQEEVLSEIRAGVAPQRWAA